ncbi:DUF4177 domain-containing protein [Lysinibacillus sp. NPDC097162]|uniref:DUF4177 domain-containing protein n=1 Tax=Lysinibacillus sp. NPDC097162 TaxID=3364140 RepID=UPI003809B6F1
MKKWEYKIIYRETAIEDQREADYIGDMLSGYGCDGWELVSITDQIDSTKNAGKNAVISVKTSSLIFIMKREYQEK